MKDLNRMNFTEYIQKDVNYGDQSPLRIPFQTLVRLYERSQMKIGIRCTCTSLYSFGVKEFLNNTYETSNSEFDEF